MLTPIISNSIWTILLKKIVGILIFGFNQKENQDLEFFKLGKNIATNY